MFHKGGQSILPEEAENMGVLTENEKRHKEAPLRYYHLNEEDRVIVKNVLLGRQPLEDLPKLRAREARIFISSTFTGKFTISPILQRHLTQLVNLEVHGIHRVTSLIDMEICFRYG